MLAEMTNINKVQQLFELKAAPTCFGLIAPVAVLQSKALVIVFALLSIFLSIGIYRNLKNSFKLFGDAKFSIFLFVLFVCWIFSTLFWTVDFASSSTKFLKLFTISLVGLGVFIGLATINVSARIRIVNALVYGACGAVALVVSRYFLFLILGDIEGGQSSFFSPSVLNPGLTVITILLWPACMRLFVQSRWKTLGIFILAYGVVLALSASGASMLALVVSGIMVLASMWQRKFVMYLLGGLTAVFMVTAHFVTPQPTSNTSVAEKMSLLPQSAQHRLYIWEFTAKRALERPIRGWGLDSSRSIPGGHDRPPIGENYLPLHPHNGALQVWLELGAPGAIMGALLCALLILKLLNRSFINTKYVYGAVVGSLLSFIVVASTAYSLWQSWWFATAWMIAAALVVFSNQREASDKIKEEI